MQQVKKSLLQTFHQIKKAWLNFCFEFQIIFWVASFRPAGRSPNVIIQLFFATSHLSFLVFNLVSPTRKQKRIKTFFFVLNFSLLQKNLMTGAAVKKFFFAGKHFFAKEVKLSSSRILTFFCASFKVCNKKPFGRLEFNSGLSSSQLSDLSRFTWPS